MKCPEGAAARRPRALAATTVGAVLGLLLSGCPQDDGTKEIPPRAVETSPVVTGDAVQSVTLVGTLEGEREVAVYAQVPERIVRLRVEEGERVRKGKVLAVLASDMQTQAVRQADAALAAMEANRDALAEDVARVRRLVDAKAAPPTQLQALEAQLRATEAQVRQTATGVSAASAQRRRAIVTAPISGKVANLRAKQGDTASPGMPLMTIVSGTRVKGVFQTPEKQFLRVKPGMHASITPLGDAAITVDAEVSLKGPVVDRRTRSGLIEVGLDNEDARLVPGSAVRTTIELSREHGVLLVPAAAVLLTATTDLDGKAIVFIAEGNIAKKREVSIGRRQGGDLIITAGLKAGETLISRGQHLLRDGSPITIANDAKASTPKADAPESKPKTTAASAENAEGDGA
jgi:RND family efflux transporter MFP subunit